MSELKTFHFVPEPINDLPNGTESFDGKIIVKSSEFILKSDHEKIVAELKVKHENDLDLYEAAANQRSKEIEALTQQLQQAEKVIEDIAQFSQIPAGFHFENYDQCLSMTNAYLAKKKGQVNE